jgi:hypothetical protein
VTFKVQNLCVQAWHTVGLSLSAGFDLGISLLILANWTPALLLYIYVHICNGNQLAITKVKVACCKVEHFTVNPLTSKHYTGAELVLYRRFTMLHVMHVKGRIENCLPGGAPNEPCSSQKVPVHSTIIRSHAYAARTVQCLSIFLGWTSDPGSNRAGYPAGQHNNSQCNSNSGWELLNAVMGRERKFLFWWVPQAKPLSMHQ